MLAGKLIKYLDKTKKKTILKVQITKQKVFNSLNLLFRFSQFLKFLKYYWQKKLSLRNEKKIKKKKIDKNYKMMTTNVIENIKKMEIDLIGKYDWIKSTSH